MKAFFSIFFVAIFAFSANAQCSIIQDISTGTKDSNNRRVLQTFTSCQDGQITSIGFKTNDNSHIGDYDLYIAQQGTGIEIVGSPYQVFNVSSNGDQLVNLDRPFPVIDGLVYEFQIITSERGTDARTSVATTGGNRYTGGACGLTGIIVPNEDRTIDMVFEVNIEDAPPIPTMSQWALMILGLIITSIAVVRIRKVAVA